MIRKVLIVVGLIGTLSFNSTASELTAWKNGFYEGAQAGYKLCKVEVKQKLSWYEDLIDSVFNTKSLMFAGKFPLPTAWEKVEVRKLPDGTAEIERSFEVLPPAYFPLSAIESLKEELEGGKKIVKGKYAVVLKTDNLPTEKIAYAYWGARKLLLNPIYLVNQKLLVMGVFDRRADALSYLSKLKESGIEGEVIPLKQPLKMKKEDEEISKELFALAERLKEKEKRLLGITSQPSSMEYLMSLLDRTVVAARALEGNPKFKDFDFLKLERDLLSIKDNILAYLSDKQPYRVVVLNDPFEERRKGYERTIRKLKEENEKLRKEVERLKALVGKVENRKTSNEIIVKYLKGEL